MIKVQTTTELIESKGGLILAGKIARQAGLGNVRSSIVNNAGTVITSLFGIMAEGKSDFESMREKRGSEFFRESLGLSYVYAKETVRLYLQQMAADAHEVIEQLRESTARIIRKAPLHGLWIQGRQYLPVDIDTTVLNNSKSKKEGVSMTYRGFDGYHPILAYIGKEGYMLDCELRPGSQHCQKGTEAFIQGCIGQLEGIHHSGRVLFRLDGGNDAFETVRAVTAQKGHYCIIKRNRRQESDEKWLKLARRHGMRVTARKGKKVWVGVVARHPRKKGEVLKDVRMVFEVTERKTDRDGNRYLLPVVEVNSWWTNLTCEAEKVIDLYHNHATSEQFHGELKHDMGVERLPSGKLAVNKIVLAVAMNAFNALKCIGQRSIEKAGRKKFKRRMIRTILRELICVAGKLVRHAGALVFKIYEKDPVLPVFLRLNALLDAP